MAQKLMTIAALASSVLFATSATALAGPETLVTQSSSSYGTYLSDDDGHAVYAFTADRKNTSACEGACAKAWPPMMTSGTPLAGPGVKASLLGTISRKAGMQVTYAGRPLYYFVGDKSERGTAGQAITHFGGSWYLVTPSGTDITKTAARKTGSSW
jgi:predicted lipoprotein with Yx(FWY)xxD motif